MKRSRWRTFITVALASSVFILALYGCDEYFNFENVPATATPTKKSHGFTLKVFPHPNSDTRVHRVEIDKVACSGPASHGVRLRRGDTVLKINGLWMTNGFEKDYKVVRHEMATAEHPIRVEIVRRYGRNILHIIRKTMRPAPVDWECPI